MFLGENGIEVPQGHIDYEEETIDYSDIEPITESDFKKDKINYSC